MKIKFAFLPLIILFSSASFSAPMLVKSGEIKFTAIGKPGFLKIRGKSKTQFPKGSLQVEKNSVTGEFDFDLSDLDTGIDLRDEHMKEKYLEIAKFPRAKLSLKSISIQPEEMNADIKKPFKAALTLHGVTQDVDGEFVYISSKKLVTANFKIKVSDFKIDIPRHLGITVSETVEIEALLNLN